jgi:acetyl esterase/lipase
MCRETTVVASATPQPNDESFEEKRKLSAHQVSKLRANFGLPDWALSTFLQRGGRGRHAIALAYFACSPMLKFILAIARRMPWALKSAPTMAIWRIWVAFNRVMPACIARRGMSDALSVEAHALHNVMWWNRLLPFPIWYCRAATSSLSIGNPPQEKRVEWIPSAHTEGLCSAYIEIQPSQQTQASRKVLLWAFGGAFVGGDVEGNRGLAEHYGRKLGCDVFVVDMRRAPEHYIQDMVLDIYRGYEWLLSNKARAENIVMLGISSGGGAILRMLQLACGNEQARLDYFEERRPVPPALPQPAGVALLGGCVELTKISNSILENSKYDLFVTPSVLETIVPLQDKACGTTDKLLMCSPLQHSMHGIAPLFLSVSEHETLIDDNLELENKARAAGVDVVLSTPPYMFHIFQLFSSFLPEARAEEQRICDWLGLKLAVEAAK